ncbi:hypothetical protein PWG71_28265 [Nocardiopsis sp. N85]|uniref:hypothetical protein n=1 Tax=Nocardiopsis sp. N85 TaxID=3029400 RepID=UPI00237F5C34|nr:hypothetical protein [Nocardiopsis sp. N85]MDE3725293.1 hypothetical protein [Nocardiopsis sp. N85]
MTDSTSRHQADIAATLRAGRELGPEYDEALAASLVERIDEAIDTSVRRHLDHRRREERPAKVGVPSNTARMVLSLVCLGVSIPITGIAAGVVGGAASLAAVWLGLIVFYIISVVGLRR